VNHYAISAVDAGEASAEFVDWVLSSDGQLILAKHGFGKP
jgi:ABC-type Fe3+ transport system substrate-binding protein